MSPYCFVCGTIRCSSNVIAWPNVLLSRPSCAYWPSKNMLDAPFTSSAPSATNHFALPFTRLESAVVIERIMSPAAFRRRELTSRCGPPS
jgi:hypothetical protein